jgi:nicotinamidase-related amidase
MSVTTIDPLPALVVIDLQRGVVSSLPDAAANPVVQRSAALAERFRAHHLPVVLVNAVGLAPGRTDAGPSVDISGLPAEWFELVDELGRRPTDHRISKRRRNAFHDTGLDTLLRDLGVTQIVLTGIATSAGVESTARSGVDYGYHVVLATDAMTDRSLDVHRHSVEQIFPKLGETGTTDEIIALLDATR